MSIWDAPKFRQILRQPENVVEIRMFLQKASLDFWKNAFRRSKLKSPKKVSCVSNTERLLAVSARTLRKSWKRKKRKRGKEKKNEKEKRRKRKENPGLVRRTENLAADLRGVLLVRQERREDPIGDGEQLHLTKFGALLTEGSYKHKGTFRVFYGIFAKEKRAERDAAQRGRAGPWVLTCRSPASPSCRGARPPRALSAGSAAGCSAGLSVGCSGDNPGKTLDFPVFAEAYFQYDF